MYGRNKHLDAVIDTILRKPKLRASIQRIMYPSGARTVSILGRDFLIDVQSEIGYYRAAMANKSNVFFRDELPQMLSVFAQLTDRATFVDAGANVGTWSVQAASLAGVLPGLKVMAFEPHPRTFQKLTKNCEPYENVTLHNSALSDSEGVLDFYETTTSGVFAAKASHWNPADPKNVIPVKILPLDNYLSGIDRIVLKIDVEGHELEVLRGASKSLKAGQIDVVFSDGVGIASIEEYRDLLEASGFIILDARTRAAPDFRNAHQPLLALKRARFA